MKEYYLLEESESSTLMIQNLQNLLESKDDNDLMMALEIVQEGGLPQKLLTHVLSILLWVNNDEIKTSAKSIFKNWASGACQSSIFEKFHAQEEIITTDSKAKEFFDHLHPDIDKNTLAFLYLKFRSLGAKYCLENQVRSNVEILQEMYNPYYGSFNFSYFHLKELPKGVGLFTDVKLINLSGNELQDLPDELVNLKKVSDIALLNTDFQPIVWQKLESFFPDAMCDYYYNLACDIKRKANKKDKSPFYMDAVEYFIKSSALRPQFAEAWHNVGACFVFYGEPQKGEETLKKAIEEYDKRILINPNSAYDIYWKSGVYSLLRNKNLALENLKKAIQLSSRYKYEAMYEEDFAHMKKDKDFKSIVK